VKGIGFETEINLNRVYLFVLHDRFHVYRNIYFENVHVAVTSFKLLLKGTTNNLDPIWQVEVVCASA